MKFYRLLAKAFPRGFRSEYEAELEAAAAELLRTEGGASRLRRWRLWIGLSVDAIGRGWAERRADRRAGGGPTGWRGVRPEIRQAIRALAARPAFGLTVVALLGITIGANTAVFTVVDATLLRPLPYADPDRLVLLWESYAPMHLSTMPWSDPDYTSVRTARAFAATAVFRPRRVVLTGRGDPVSIRAASVEGGLFTLLGAHPSRGRLLDEADTRAGRTDIAVLSYATWTARFGGDPAIVGRAISIDNEPVTVVGILEPGVSFPPPITFSGQMVAPESEIYLPYRIDANPTSRGSHASFAVARLHPGVSIESARAELTAMANDVERQFPDTNTGIHMTAVPLHGQSVLTIRTVLIVLLTAVGRVLLIACASIANLMLARAAGRSREMALRAALGASRASLCRQLLFESLALGAAGTLAGLGVAQGIARAVHAFDPIELPGMFQLAFDWRVLLFTTGLTLTAVLVFGLIPALQGSRADLVSMLRSGTRTTHARSDRTMKGALVVAQVSAALVLLVASGLMVRSLMRLWSVDPGFRADGIAAMGISLPSTRYQTDDQVRAFQDQAIDRIGRIAGVTGVSAVTALPFASQVKNAGDYSVVGLPPRKTGDYLIANYQRVTPGFVGALKMRLLEGRDFVPGDAAGSPNVAMVSESLARRHWAPGQAVGHQLRLGDTDDVPAKTIVGVVADVRMEGFDARIEPTIYVPLAQSPSSAFWFVIATGRSPDAVAGEVRAAIRSIDASLPAGTVRSLEGVVGDTVKKPRFTAMVLGAFAVIALLIAAVGLYGLLAFDVAQQRHELGVRMALGATSGRIRRLVLARGLRLAGVGLAVGAALSVPAMRLLKDVLFDVGPADGMAFSAAAGVLAVTAIVATWFPARRATRADPIEALRGE